MSVVPSRSFLIKRSGIDATRLYYRCPATLAAWTRLLRSVDATIPLVFPGSEAPILVRRGKGNKLIVEGTGFRVIVFEPGSMPVDAQRPYPVQLLIFGSGLSYSTTGIQTITAVRAGVEDLVFGWVSSGRHHPRERDEEPLPGRFDWAVDVAVGGVGSEDFFVREIALDGNLERIAAHYVTGFGAAPRVYPKTGGPPNYISWFGAQKALRLYCKRDHFSLGTQAPLEATWRQAGWNGADPIVRVEFCLHRAKLKSVLRKLGEPLPEAVTYEEFLAQLPEIGNVLTKRHRHLALNTAATKNCRKTSAFWAAVSEAMAEHAPAALGDEDTNADGAARGQAPHTGRRINDAAHKGSR